MMASVSASAESSSPTETTATIVVAAAFGAFVLLLLVLLAVQKRNAYIKANAPVDWLADFETQLQVLKDAGLIDPEMMNNNKRVPRELKRAEGVPSLAL